MTGFLILARNSIILIKIPLKTCLNEIKRRFEWDLKQKKKKKKKFILRRSCIFQLWQCLSYFFFALNVFFFPPTKIHGNFQHVLMTLFDLLSIFGLAYNPIISILWLNQSMVHLQVTSVFRWSEILFFGPNQS